MRENTTRYVLLGILAEAGSATGYDVRQWIEQAIGHFWSESFGQIYPELRRLLEAGLIERADEGNGPRDRKRYRITEAGRAALAAWLDKAPRPDLRRSELLLKLFFGRFGEEAEARAWLEGARREALARIACLHGAARQVLQEEGESPGLPYYLITIDAGRRAARARVEWAEAALRTLDLHRAGDVEAIRSAAEGK
jgi:DNA-binding PadR family transcriptional regulator